MKKILYLSPVDWFWIKQRPQHMCEKLSKNYKVSFFSIKSWTGNEMLKNSHTENQSISESSTFKINENLTIIRKNLFPFQGSLSFIKNLNVQLYTKYIHSLDAKENFEIIIMTHPNDFNIVSSLKLKNKVLIYDCMDNYKNFSGNNFDETVNNEINLTKISDLIIVSSDDLFKEIIKYDENYQSKTIIINNGVDMQTFDLSKYNQITNITISNKKKIGYIGTISEWLDLELIKNFALKHKNVEFYLYGPIDKSVDVNSYKTMQNIFFEGVKPYSSLPSILSEIDIAIMPFKVTDLIKSVNPVKIYEYLAMGKPVLAVHYPEMIKFGDLIETYDSALDFEEILLRMLTVEHNVNDINRKVEFARMNSWDERISILDLHIKKLVDIEDQSKRSEIKK